MALLGLAALSCPPVSWFSPWNVPGIYELREDVFLWALPKSRLLWGGSLDRGLLQGGLGSQALWGLLTFSFPWHTGDCLSAGFGGQRVSLRYKRAVCLELKSVANFSVLTGQSELSLALLSPPAWPLGDMS